MTQIDKIIIRYIPHKQQRYDTVGDWYFHKYHVIREIDEKQESFEQTELVIRVSNDHPDYPTQADQEAVALHELFEVLLCNHAGVTQKQVDDFDFAHASTIDEPGENPEAPYHVQHMMADVVERLYIQAVKHYNPGKPSEGGGT